MQRVHGSIRVRVTYPGPSDVVEAGDSSYLYGSVGEGSAHLSINGQRVPVWPNGAWLAWIPFPRDSVMSFTLHATALGDSATLVYRVRRAHFTPPHEGLWVDTASFFPRGKVWWPAAEYLPLSVRAKEGARLTLRLSDGTSIPLEAEPTRQEVPAGIRAFDRDPLNLVRPVLADRYRGVIRGVGLGQHPGAILGPDPVSLPDGLSPILEAVLAGDTIHVRWPLGLAMMDTLPMMAALDDDPSRTGETDRITVGRALPAGTYHWFFPTGTQAVVRGRMNGDLRVELAQNHLVWVAASEATVHSVGIMRPAVVGSATLSPQSDRSLFRIPVSRPIPVQVEETEHGLVLTLYGAVGDVNWIRYGGTDPFVRTIAWRQAQSDVVEFTFDLDAPVWGYRSRWDNGDLVLEIRRPPLIDGQHPLRGRLIAIDPGHPPIGATGPTGLSEAEANLGVATIVRDLLRAAGARVIMTRSTDRPIELWPRIRMADSLDAEILVSIHNNALPDGVNPFTNNGSSVFYNHPKSLPLARFVQRQLIRRLGLRDLGVTRGDLAMARPTWMPAILTEGLYLIMPDQEAALRAEGGRRLYAEAVVDGLREYLADFQHRAGR